MEKNNEDNFYIGVEKVRVKVAVRENIRKQVTDEGRSTLEVNTFFFFKCG